MLTDAHKHQLRQLAAQSIDMGLQHQRPLQPNLEALPPELRAPGASFVTLEIQGALRGCIGSVQARRALALDVCEHAYDAAFCDHRFPALTPSEQDQLHLSISVLDTPVSLHFTDEADLLAQLKPDVDGVILRDGHHQSTFLPAVWKKLPNRQAFWQELKCKAGLPKNYWSTTLTAQRYQVICF